ncbi:MAG: 3-phosphoshikimate 1-carboxyvinyltransferase [Candidatus Cloacimonetes bacterium]|nr:3-phosphoshikimate 1-carboxyvinyltransferase [Candidatus Cloacimonadota bacterium]
MKNYLQLSGQISLEGSKSILNRILIIATFLEEPLKIMNPSNCSDISTMLNNLSKLGLNVEKKELSWNVLPLRNIRKQGSMFISDSGSAWRFLTARLASIPRTAYTIEVSEQLQKRPMKPLWDILSKMGAVIKYSESKAKIKGANLKGGVHDLLADISSQFLSSLLLIAPSYKIDLELFLDGNIVSRPYLEMTIKIMQEFGIIVDFSGNRIFIQKGQSYNNLKEYTIEPDYSSACYIWALGALSRSEIYTNKGNSSSVQPDYKFLDILQTMGANVKIESNKIGVCRKILKGITIDMQAMPDQVPTLAVLALFANSKTRILNIGHLKYKESDRINGLITQLSEIGAKLTYENDVMTIKPLDTIPGDVILETYRDHRLIMAFYILKLIFPQINIKNSTFTEKSYPNFLNDIRSLIS